MLKKDNLKLKFSLRAMLCFEALAKKPFELKTATDQVLFLYAIIISYNDIQIDFKEFVDALDDDTELHRYLMDWLIQQIRYRDQFNQVEDDKKKVVE